MSNLSGTPFDALFDALTRAMGIPHAVSSAPSQRQRVVWERSGALKPQRSPYARDNEKTLGRLGHPWTATVYGDSDLEVSALVGQLWAHLDCLVGPPNGDRAIGEPGDDDFAPESPGYDFTPGAIGPQGGDGKAAGYACACAVELRQTVAAVYYPPAPPAVSISLDVDTTAPGGSAPATAASFSVEA